jgi:hypothetical protein
MNVGKTTIRNNEIRNNAPVPLIGLGIFHGDLDFFDLHEKSLDLSNYEIFPHKILKSRTFKKSSILIVNMDFTFRRFFTLLKLKENAKYSRWEMAWKDLFPA